MAYRISCLPIRKARPNSIKVPFNNPFFDCSCITISLGPLGVSCMMASPIFSSTPLTSRILQPLRPRYEQTRSGYDLLYCLVIAKYFQSISPILSTAGIPPWPEVQDDTRVTCNGSICVNIFFSFVFTVCFHPSLPSRGFPN